jgi:protein-tyrosine phosphatase
MIDLHSHLLPGIDDGCGTLAESLACVRTLMARGFTGTVCTPHMAVASFPDNAPAPIAAQVVALQQELRRAGLDYRLWAGGELRIAAHTVDWLRRHGVPTVGPSRHVLVDYWGTSWPGYGDLVLEYLAEQGYQPVLAHPERMDFDEAEWDEVLTRLEQEGVWLQGNLRCLAGHEGPEVRRRSERLLRERRYRVLATDMHSPEDLPPRLAGIAVVEELAGAAARQELLSQRTRDMVAPGA